MSGSERNRLRGAGAAALLVPLLAGCLAGCDSAPSGAMSNVAPPDGWAAGLQEQREAKDREFREDPQTPLLPEAVSDFEGLDYWAPDPDYYFVGPVNLHYKPERFTIVSTSGRERPCEKAGWVRFAIGGQSYTLQVYRLLDQPSQPGAPGFFLPFMDATTGHQTYPAGRYVDLVGPAAGPYVLDFNSAYNPLCAYGAPERYICPVTPSENRLPVSIEAGERGFRPEGS
jgi:uncharacterized protein (DUF1684 family)